MKNLNKEFIKKLIPYAEKCSKNDPIHFELNQALFIYFDYGYENDDKIYKLMFELIDFIKKNDLGVLDGHELALDHSDGIYYLYSSNVEKLYIEIKPILLKTDFLKNAKINMRFGPLDSRTNEITIALK